MFDNSCIFVKRRSRTIPRVTEPVTTPPWRAALLDQTPEAIIGFGADARLVYCSPSIEQLLGYEPELLAGTSVLDLVHPDDLVRASANIDGLSVGARPMPGMLRIRHANGRWLELELRPWSVELADPPEGPGTLTAVVLRDNSNNDAHWTFLAALASGEVFRRCLTLFAEGLSTPIDGPMGISFVDGDRRAAVGPVPPLLAGVAPDGGLDATPGTPWARAAVTGEPAWCAVDDLPDELRAEATALGAGAVVAVPVPDPSSAGPVMMVQWPAATAMAPILAEALRRRPREAISIALDRRAVTRRLERLALHDPLTDVANRTRFFDVLGELVDSAVPYGVLYVDLDRFKPINDTHGHLVGDEVLVHCARRLEHAARSLDVVARFGGDEFAVACPNVDEHGLEIVAARVVASLAEPVHVGEKLLLDVGASVGCALGGPAADPDAVIAAADTALYEAKRAGRGVWRRGPTVT
jgi:diguanylate cyclase (GGDEF)-like protein/PAS domain S-box-containing protein